MAQILAYHILKSICDELNIKMALVPGFTAVHAGFHLEKETKVREFFSGAKYAPLRTRGTCRGSTITIGSSKVSREYDLHDPDSIPKLTRWLKSNRCWA
jgi:hypothetical protein